MKEIECLRKIALSAIKMNKYKKKYDQIMREYKREYPLVDYRYSKKNINSRAKLIEPIYEQYKEHKRQLEGYLLIYEVKDYK